MDLILSYLPQIIALIIAVVVHEFMHGYTAFRLGDNTPKLDNRISLNPINHIDPIGSILLPLLLIISRVGVVLGWAKPVRINDLNFKNPRRDSAIVSLAGPLSNLALVLIFSLPLRFESLLNPLVAMFFAWIVYINIILMVFNLIPIPPLDGSKVLYYFLPANVNIRNLEMYGPIILLALLFIPGSPLLTILGLFVGLILNIIGMGSIIPGLIG